jgi:hypothetical protein
MTGELAIVYVFQSAVGRLYQAVGALFATYMLGLVVGSALAKPDRGSARRRAVKLALARVGMIAVGLLAMALAGRAQASLYFVALFAYALAMGYEYPLANAIYLGDEGGRTAAGVLHAADHFGAALAALLGGALLLPLIGPVATLGLAVCLHVVALTGLGALFHGEQHADDRCPTS